MIVTIWKSEFTGYTWLVGDGNPRIKATRECDRVRIEKGARGTYSTRQALKDGKMFRINEKK